MICVCREKDYFNEYIAVVRQMSAVLNINDAEPKSLKNFHWDIDNVDFYV